MFTPLGKRRPISWWFNYRDDKRSTMLNLENLDEQVRQSMLDEVEKATGITGIANTDQINPTAKAPQDAKAQV